MENVPTRCTFCSKFGEEGSGSRHPVFDRIILEDENFVVVPAVGSLVEGYLLIISKTHVTSMGQLSREILASLEGLKGELRDILTDRFLPPIFFEHGLVCEDRKIGSCIDHAHLHCVPLATSLVPRLKSFYQLQPLAKFEDIHDLSTGRESYLYFETQEATKFVITGIIIASQFLRRLISEEVGIPDLWDWAAYPFENNAVSTLRRLAVQ